MSFLKAFTNWSTYFKDEMIERIYISLNNIKKIQMVYCMKILVNFLNCNAWYESLTSAWSFKYLRIFAETSSGRTNLSFDFPLFRIYPAEAWNNLKIYLERILFTFLVSTSNVHNRLSSAFGRSYKMCHPIKRFESENILFQYLESNVHSFKTCWFVREMD